MRFCTVVQGITTKSSWSCPVAENPFASRTPTTLHGNVLRRTVFPTGSSIPKRLSATVCPRTQTGASASRSACVKNCPDRTVHRRISRNSGLTPRYCVAQFSRRIRPECDHQRWASLIIGTWPTIASASRMMSERVPRAPSEVRRESAPRFDPDEVVA